MRSQARTPEEYIAELPPERAEAIGAVRQVVLDNLPEGYTESMEFGMIAYSVPLERFPDTYNGKPLQYAALASQKNYMSLYLMCLYADTGVSSDFRAELANEGVKLDMGKSCIRFRSLDQLPLDVVGRAVASTPVQKYIEAAQKAHG
jgi:hypothetical protein